jgi:hypothetical protein
LRGFCAKTQALKKSSGAAVIMLSLKLPGYCNIMVWVDGQGGMPNE